MDNIGSGNGLMPDGTKPSPEPILTCHQEDHEEHISEHFLQECFWEYSSKSNGKYVFEMIFFSHSAKKL